MSTIVFLGSPAHGHTNPTLPVVLELVQRGESVTCYNHEEFRQPIERTGAVFRPYPPTEISSPEIATAIQGGNLMRVGGLMLGATAQLLPFLLDDLPRLTPQLVIFDSLALWGRMAATRLGLRAAASISHFVYDQRYLMSADEHSLHYLRQALPEFPRLLAARWRLSRRYPDAFPRERPLLPLRGGLNLVYTARALQPDTPLIDETFRFVGPSINPQTRAQDFPLDALGPGQVIYISLGTVHHSHADFYRQCFRAFAAHPARFVLALGDEVDLSDLGAIPPNFIAWPSVPQLALLQRADVFVTHGGMNSLHEGLYYGVPLVLVPHQLEQLLNARLVAQRGAGLILDQPLAGKALTADHLRQALDAVLAGENFRRAAASLQQLLRATGGYRQAADEIQSHITAAPLAR